VTAAPEVAPAIVAEAAGDTIVMATHARTGLGRVFMGSVTDGVVRSAAGAVLLIPPPPRPPVAPRRRKSDAAFIEESLGV
jgi:nucleotide-binding universal stress UspA family protein